MIRSYYHSEADDDRSLSRKMARAHQYRSGRGMFRIDQVGVGVLQIPKNTEGTIGTECKAGDRYHKSIESSA
jgi:hypothetical protein